MSIKVAGYMSLDVALAIDLICYFGGMYMITLIAS